MELELNLERLLNIWWSLVWRVLVGGFVAGFVVGGIGGFVLGLIGQSNLIPAVVAVLSWLAAIPVSIWALRASLLKKRSEYKIVLIKNTV